MRVRVAAQASLALVLSSAWARTATACAVCLSATDQTRDAYWATTALLVLLPPLLVGAMAIWLRRAARRGRWRVAAGVERRAEQ
jgi:hypothetical protein